ncbi:5'/3'-nucleotidase SurE [Methylobacterium oryzisoli]|uniref:5'/3'-nucleotidase SurE n=1 Tax=Methylobacterium oryzisoli TaxID=3385502 RepID=UPI00389176AE
MALNILLTNDDGYNAPGIQSLYNSLVAAGHNVHIVAPQVNQSAQGSSLGGTAAVSSPISITQFSPGNYYVDGRPATAALTGLNDLFAGARPDVVISGTNRGENIGTSENISGTVNAALQGLYEGVPSIAVSAGSFNGSYDAAFANAGTFTADFLARLEAQRAPGAPLLPPGEGLSINVPGNPTLAGVAVTTVTPESSGSFPYALTGPNTYAEGFVANTTPSGSTTSEGSQFISSRITVSPIDGNWGSNAADRAALAARLGSAPSVDQAATGPLNILLLNEDGYGAAGITATRDALLAKGYNVTVLAPNTDQSNVGSALFLNPITVTTYSARNYSANGTPASLVSLALDPQGLLNGMPRPDLVIAGADVGNAVGIENANHSATVAAAATALFNYGVPSIAVSSAGGSAADLAASAGFVARLVVDLQATQGSDATILPQGVGLSVNVPAGANGSRYAYTTIDRATNANLSVTGTATQATFVSNGVVTSNQPDSEGTAFNGGAITISPIDGNYSSNQLSTYQALAGDLGTEFGQPSAGYTTRSTGQGSTQIDLIVPAALVDAAGTSGADTVVYSGFGTVTLPGTIENARLTGPGSNLLIGNALDNLLSAEAGNDSVSGLQGNDTIDGGVGNDTLFGDAGADRVDGGLGDDQVRGYLGNDTLFGSAGNDSVFGEEDDDFIGAGSGNDYLSGGLGNDALYGEAGNDLLFGNAGNDELVGGAGSDTFAFGRGDGADLIRDFVTGGSERDVIAFNGGVFASFAAVQAATRQVGTDAVIAYGSGDTLTLQNVQSTALSAQNFTFA